MINKFVSFILIALLVPSMAFAFSGTSGNGMVTSANIAANLPTWVVTDNYTENVLTTGSVTGGSITDGTANLVGGALSAVTTIDLTGAISGAAGLTMSGTHSITDTASNAKIIIKRSDSITATGRVGFSGSDDVEDVQFGTNVLVAGGAEINVAGTNRLYIDPTGAVTMAGALSGITTLGLSGAITGATATDTINGLIVNAGALSGITTLDMSGDLTASVINTTGASYGGVYADANGTATTITTANVWVTITQGATAYGINENTSHASGVLTIDTAGTYQVSFSSSFSGSNGDDLQMGMSVNDADPIAGSILARDVSSAGAIGNAAKTCYIALAATNTLRLKCKNITDTDDITHEYWNFTITRVDD